MRFQCQHCGNILAVENTDLGIDVQCGHCSQIARSPETRLSFGAVINDFIIQKELGRGGMGIVFESYQISLDRQAAVKVLADKYASDAEFVTGFIKEARAAAKLNHPHIVQAYAVGEDEGIFYFAMESVDGETMKDVLKREGIIPVEKAITVISEISEALDYAWTEAGLVHRDIKPDNIMLTSNNKSKLADLGLAKVAGDQEDTDSDEVMGTPQYISPEHLTGAVMDVRSDIYSLGATFYHLITGKFAFEGTDATDIARKHLQEPLVPPHKVNKKINKYVSMIICKMMAKNVNQRYQSADELVDDLRMVRRGKAPLSFSEKQLSSMGGKAAGGKTMSLHKSTVTTSSKRFHKDSTTTRSFKTNKFSTGKFSNEEFEKEVVGSQTLSRARIKPKTNNSKKGVILIVLFLITVGGAGYYFFQKAQQSKKTKPVKTNTNTTGLLVGSTDVDTYFYESAKKLISEINGSLNNFNNKKVKISIWRSYDSFINNGIELQNKKDKDVFKELQELMGSLGLDETVIENKRNAIRKELSANIKKNEEIRVKKEQEEAEKVAEKKRKEKQKLADKRRKESEKAAIEKAEQEKIAKLAQEKSDIEKMINGAFTDSRKLLNSRIQAEDLDNLADFFNKSKDIQIPATYAELINPLQNWEKTIAEAAKCANGIQNDIKNGCVVSGVMINAIFLGESDKVKNGKIHYHKMGEKFTKAQIPLSKLKSKTLDKVLEKIAKKQNNANAVSYYHLFSGDYDKAIATANDSDWKKELEVLKSCK